MYGLCLHACMCVSMQWGCKQSNLTKIHNDRLKIYRKLDIHGTRLSMQVVCKARLIGHSNFLFSPFRYRIVIFGFIHHFRTTSHAEIPECPFNLCVMMVHAGKTKLTACPSCMVLSTDTRHFQLTGTSVKIQPETTRIDKSVWWDAGNNLQYAEQVTFHILYRIIW